MRADGSRTDALDNRQRLVAAVGRLLAVGREPTLSAVADEADVSRSTAYRNFSTPEQAVLAFIDDFLSDFEAAVTLDGCTSANLRDMCAAWGALVDQRSTALVHVRSAEGFLARVRRGDPVISRIDRTVRAALTADTSVSSLSARDLDHAVFLWNLLLDPRELVDLAEHDGTSIAEATTRLTEAFLVLLDHLADPAPPARS